MVPINQLSEKLVLALKDLDQWAVGHQVKLEIIIIGAFALYLKGLELRATNDIDTLTELEDELLLQAIEEIAQKYGLNGNWLNDQACGLSVPDGFLSRLSRVALGSHIVALVPSRQDLISLKSAAFIVRGGEDPKDYTDLQALQPNRLEIEAAIRFVRKTNTPPQPRFYPDFEEMIGRLRELAQ
ncbi:unnamed protein product [Sphagnum tenellum]